MSEGRIPRVVIKPDPRNLPTHADGSIDWSGVKDPTLDPPTSDAERLALAERRAAESEARARVAEGAYQQMRGEAIAVTPGLRAAVERVRELEAKMAAPMFDDELGVTAFALDCSRRALSTLILSAMPPVQP